MNDYIEVRLDATPCSEALTDILAAYLAEAGFESFVPDDKGLTAYVRKELYSADAVEEAVNNLPIDAEITLTTNEIEGRDWNSEWEKNYFQPIVIGSRCVVHSSFHTDVPVCDYDIAIDPKMAFGTGHHATTSQMVEQLLDREVEGKTVVDMGTGTGILAILASMRGASRVVAVEIDPVAHVNAAENLRINGADGVTELRLGDASQLKSVEGADMLLANINRNIVIADMPAYAAALKIGGTLLLSGFYTADLAMVREAAEAAGMEFESSTSRQDWACAAFTRKR